jgi:hypothetical protein
MSAIRQNSPPVGTVKTTPNGKKMKMTIRGWERVNPVLDKQNQDKKKKKQSKAEQAVRSLRENSDGKAGLPRTNRA